MKRLLEIIAALLVACAAQAEGFPSKPITLICPWPAGGTTDAHLRKFAAIAQKYLGQPLVVHNKPGGSGMIGPSSMAKLAKPDGYTLSQLPITAFRLPHQQQVEWDPLRDFTYVIGISGYTFGVVVRADSAFKSFRDLIDYARANSGKLSYGSPGTGTSPHLLMEEVALKTGVQFLHVPFKGNAESTLAVMGGHVVAQSDSSGWGRYVDAGTFRLLVTFGEKRSKWNAPTAKELGIDIVSYSPYGIVGPKGIDAKVVKILHDAFKKTLDDPEHLKVLQSLDQVYWYKSSEAYAQWGPRRSRRSERPSRELDCSENSEQNRIAVLRAERSMRQRTYISRPDPRPGSQNTGAARGPVTRTLRARTMDALRTPPAAGRFGSSAAKTRIAPPELQITHSFLPRVLSPRPGNPPIAIVRLDDRATC